MICLTISSGSRRWVTSRTPARWCCPSQSKKRTTIEQFFLKMTAYEYYCPKKVLILSYHSHTMILYQLSLYQVEPILYSIYQVTQEPQMNLQESQSSLDLGEVTISLVSDLILSFGGSVLFCPPQEVQKASIRKKAYTCMYFILQLFNDPLYF